jgi:very-short-patch-repair endonuclease
MKTTSDQNRAKAIRLIDYLMRLASLRTKIIRDVNEYAQVLWFDQIPREKGCFSRSWGEDEEYSDDVWIEVKTTREPELPEVPLICRDWVNRESLRKTDDLPELMNTIIMQGANPVVQNDISQAQLFGNTAQIENHPNIKKAWENYLEQKWIPWAEEYKKWESVHRVYSTLFAIHQEQLRLGEEYELILGFGLLTWQTPSNQPVRRHLVVANALLEFEAKLGKFVVRPNPDGANLRPELDMLDIDEQPARAEETAKETLEIAADDPWAKDIIEDVLKALVHSISPDGEYHEGLESKKTQFLTKPMVEYSPALILRKRSVRGLTDVLKRIRDRIENGEEIPFEFGDLAEITDTNSGSSITPTDSDLDEIGCEIYFPKPSNEEQRRIVEKTRVSTGVLVQGPPGTGKSHTIANLICHLLATGQRTLITAKTPRALQVLEKLIPEELRPLCISLLGSGLEEKRSLEASVNAVLRKNEEWDEPFAQKQIKEKEQNLFQLRKEKTEIENRLRAIRESETHSQNVADGFYRGTASQIAQLVQKDKDKYGWFIDKVPFDVDYPLTDINLIQFLKDLRWLTLEKRQELSRLWPEAIEPLEQFENLVDKERKVEQEVDRTMTGIDKSICDCLCQVDEEKIRSIQKTIDELYADIHRLKSTHHVWAEKAIHDVSSEQDSIWRELEKQTLQIESQIENHIQKVESTEVSLPEGCDPKVLCRDAATLKKHLAEGGKIGWGPFRPKIVKSVLHIIKNVHVDGQPCNNIERVTLLVDILRVRIELERGWNLWGEWAKRAEGALILQYRSFESLGSTLRDILSLGDKIKQGKGKLSGFGNLPALTWHEEHYLQILIRTCAHAITIVNKDRIKEQLKQIETPISSLAAKTNSHQVTKELVEAVRTRSIDAYLRAKSKIEQLNGEKKSAHCVESILNRIKQYAPLLSNDLRQNAGNPAWDERILHLLDAWRWSKAQQWLIDYIKKDDATSLAKRFRQIEEELGQTIAQVASLRAWSFCFSRMREEHRRNMEAWEQEMRRLGKGTGKHAPRHRREAQKHLNNCREAVPAWIMPLHRVWDTVDPAPAMFDMIIVDEASQCGFEALPLFYLSKKILIVGDDKQISPDAVGVSGDTVSRLMDEYLHDFVFKASFDVVQSLFEHGKLRYGTRRIGLCEHFRCMPEIIQFSNDLCYSDTPLIPLRQYPQERLTPIVPVHVSNGYREGSESRVINRPEAQAVVQKIVELCRDEKYNDKTMGVIVLQGDAQARLIEAQLLEQLGAEEMEKRRLVCGNPYSFQGDERDIIFLSMVAAPNERIGPMTMISDERRFNVAVSRARDQMWLFHSVDCNDLSRSCLRRRLLEFFQQTKSQIIAGIDCDELRRQSEGVNRSIIKPPNPFDSWFEVDVSLEIARRGYQVLPQFNVAGKRIDIVVEGGQARLAVECDGDEFHGVDNYENDMQRQRKLERCGWVFFRVRASEFYSDKKGALSYLWKMLNERGITAQGFESTFEEESTTISSSDITSTLKVEVGDTVVYIEEKNPREEHQVLITRSGSMPDYGVININTPLAQALLGSHIGDLVEAKLPLGSVHLIIKQIKKISM